VGTGLDNRRFYAIALIIQTLIGKVSPVSRWKERLKAHIDAYPDVDTAHMHFPPNWAECRLPRGFVLVYKHGCRAVDRAGMCWCDLVMGKVSRIGLMAVRGRGSLQRTATVI
jgi:hypothetical protein